MDYTFKTNKERLTFIWDTVDEYNYEAINAEDAMGKITKACNAIISEVETAPADIKNVCGVDLDCLTDGIYKIKDGNLIKIGTW